MLRPSLVGIALVILPVIVADSASAQTQTRTADLSAVKNADVKAAADTDFAVNNSREANEEAWYDRHEMTLTTDGTIPGNLRTFDENGALVPARVKLFFLHNGQVVSQSMPNEQGDFQISGLQPGTYSVVAAGQSGFAAMGVRILPPPNRPEAPKANTIGKVRAVSQPLGLQLRMNLSLINPVDIRPAFQLAAQQNAGGLGSFPGGFGTLGGAPGGVGGLGGGAGGAAGGGAGGGLGGIGGGLGLSPALTSGLVGALTAGAVAGAVSSSNNNESSPNGSGS